MSRFTFRLICIAMTGAGALILALSLHGRHRPPADDGSHPTIPRTESSDVAR